MGYVDTMNAYGEAILHMADPESRWRGYTEGWLFTDFSTAGTIALAYVLFVIIGSTVMKAGVSPIDPYPLKFVYNVSQIMLCAYMTIEAFMMAYRSGYHVLPCNKFDTVNPPLANLLWLFLCLKNMGLLGHHLHCSWKKMETTFLPSRLSPHNYLSLLLGQRACTL